MATETKPNKKRAGSPRGGKTELPSTLRPDAGANPGILVSLYDRVSSLIVALLFLVGISVLGVVIVFFSRLISRAPVLAVPVTAADIATHEGSPGGSGRDLEEPATDEIPELAEIPAADKLASVNDAVSAREALFEDISMSGAVVGGQGRGHGRGNGIGDGDGGVQEKTPRAQRWEIRFQSADLVAYAKTLDAFGIELAVLNAADNTVIYAFNLAKPKPDRRVGTPDQEKRLYMTWRSGPLQAADRELLSKAGIQVGTNIAMQFYPPKVENDLAKMELKSAGNRSVDDIRKTVYGVKQTGGNYEFFVLEQKYF